MNQENICTLLSNFPDFNLDQCLEDALNFSSATPISLTTTAQQQLQEEVSPQNGDGCSDDGWMNHLTRSLHQFNLTHAKMLSTYADSNMGKRGARHQRGHCLVRMHNFTPNQFSAIPASLKCIVQILSVSYWLSFLNILVRQLLYDSFLGLECPRVEIRVLQEMIDPYWMLIQYKSNRYQICSFKQKFKFYHFFGRGRYHLHADNKLLNSFGRLVDLSLVVADPYGCSNTFAFHILFNKYHQQYGGKK